MINLNMNNVIKRTPDYLPLAISELGKMGLYYSSYITYNCKEGYPSYINYSSEFVGWCLEKSGVKSTKNVWPLSYKYWGNNEKEVGSIVVFDDKFTQVGILKSFDDKQMEVITVNEEDKVSIVTVNNSKVISCRTPSSVSVGTTRVDDEKLNANIWNTTFIDSAKIPLVNNLISNICDRKKQYIEIEKRTSIPWYIVACIDYKCYDMSSNNLYEKMKACSDLYPSGWTINNSLKFANKYFERNNFNSYDFIWDGTNFAVIHDDNNIGVVSILLALDRSFSLR